MSTPADHPGPARRERWGGRSGMLLGVVALLVALVAGGCGGGGQPPAAEQPPPPVQATGDGAAEDAAPTEQVGTAAAPGGSPTPAPAGTKRGDGIETIPLRQFERLPPSPPVSVSIPRIGVESDLIGLGLEAGGEMEVPEDFDRAGWFTEGPEPGQVGPAVIAGHVDSKSGPAIFYRLRELRRGDTVRVERADGRTLEFVVEGLEQFAKAEFPTEAVFGPVPFPALRLITCGGTFDQGSGHYRDNVIVSARLAPPSP